MIAPVARTNFPGFATANTFLQQAGNLQDATKISDVNNALAAEILHDVRGKILVDLRNDEKFQSLLKEHPDAIGFGASVRLRGNGKDYYLLVEPSYAISPLNKPELFTADELSRYIYKVGSERIMNPNGAFVTGKDGETKNYSDKWTISKLVTDDKTALPTNVDIPAGTIGERYMKPNPKSGN